MIECGWVIRLLYSYTQNSKNDLDYWLGGGDCGGGGTLTPPPFTR